MKEISIITLSNKGYIDYTTNLINSIKTNKVNINISIHVMDTFSLNYFQKLEQNVFLIVCILRIATTHAQQCLKRQNFEVFF